MYSLFFKSYGKDVMNLQSATVHAIFCDEELEIYKLLKHDVLKDKTKEYMTPRDKRALK